MHVHVHRRARVKAHQNSACGAQQELCWAPLTDTENGKEAVGAAAMSASSCWSVLTPGGCPPFLSPSWFISKGARRRGPESK